MGSVLSAITKDLDDPDILASLHTLQELLDAKVLYYHQLLKSKSDENFVPAGKIVQYKSLKKYGVETGANEKLKGAIDDAIGKNWKGALMKGIGAALEVVLGSKSAGGKETHDYQLVLSYGAVLRIDYYLYAFQSNDSRIRTTAKNAVCCVACISTVNMKEVPAEVLAYLTGTQTHGQSLPQLPIPEDEESPMKTAVRNTAYVELAQLQSKIVCNEQGATIDEMQRLYSKIETFRKWFNAEVQQIPEITEEQAEQVNRLRDEYNVRFKKLLGDLSTIKEEKEFIEKKLDEAKKTKLDAQDAYDEATRKEEDAQKAKESAQVAYDKAIGKKEDAQKAKNQAQDENEAAKSQAEGAQTAADRLESGEAKVNAIATAKVAAVRAEEATKQAASAIAAEAEAAAAAEKAAKQLREREKENEKAKNTTEMALARLKSYQRTIDDCEKKLNSAES